MHGHQIVAHWVGNDYRCNDYYNPVDGAFLLDSFFEFVLIVFSSSCSLHLTYVPPVLQTTML